MFRATDERGFVTEYAHDPQTDAVIRMARDVNGLNIVSDTTVDEFGRTIETLGPQHDVDGQQVRHATWTVHKNDFETWTGRGYVKSGGQKVLVNLVQIQRYSTDDSVMESISATRGQEVESVGQLLATDSFPQTSWTSWSQTRTNEAGQKTESRRWHDIPNNGDGAEDGIRDHA